MAQKGAQRLADQGTYKDEVNIELHPIVNTKGNADTELQSTAITSKMFPRSFEFTAICKESATRISFLLLFTMYVQLLAQSCCYLQWFCSFQLNLAVIYHAFATWACIELLFARNWLQGLVPSLGPLFRQAAP